MSSLLNKINTLLRSRVEGFLEEDLRLGGNRERRSLLSADRLGGDIDREISALRERIEQAIGYEEDLQAQIDALRQEAADWDLQADNALLDNDEVTARNALARMKRAEQKASLLEADLIQHRRNTADFIERVNVLEGLVAEARTQEHTTPPSTPTTTLDTVLQTTRIEVEVLEGEEQASPPAAQPPSSATAQQSDAHADDLATRRARLARHNPEQEE